MYLYKLQIKNFRKIKESTIHFRPGLNILIGENNSGKSSIIDALRLCLNLGGNQRRDLFVTLDDFHIDSYNPTYSSEDIEFHLSFKKEKDEELVYFGDLHAEIEINDVPESEFQLHYRYNIYQVKGVKKVKYSVWGGENEGQRLNSDTDLFNMVYLGALRDAVSSLRPSKGNILGELYSKLQTDENEQKRLAGILKDSIGNDPDWNELIVKGQNKIIEHLSSSSVSGDELNVEIDFIPFEFRRIVDTLVMEFPIYTEEQLGATRENQKYFSVYQNGLGYNNLVYIATILGNLKEIKESENSKFVSLLVEEPEAHLHPQLQNVFFDYLNKLNELGLQVFLSSHSPTITARSNLDSLIVIQNKKSKNYAFALSQSILSKNNKEYLSKFLDVTKSQLFFSKGVILVEGISEALLLPVFSKIMGDEFRIEKAGIETVNLNGVAFEHFGKLFNSDEEEKRLNFRCVIITDDDRTEESEEVSSRALKAKELEGGLLKVELATITFEYELFMHGENRNILLDTFRELHPIAASNIKEGESLNDFAMNFIEKVKANKAKSRLAHSLAHKLEGSEELQKRFTVPAYIQNAIKYVLLKD